MLEDAKGRKVEKLLKASFDPTLFTRQALPQQEWAPSVCQVQLCGMRPHSIQYGGTHFGCMECWLVVSGSETVFCLPPAVIPGSDFAQKRVYLQSCNGEAFKAIMVQGFAAKSDGASLLVVPSGMFTVILSGDVRGVRWSVASDERDNQRVKEFLAGMIAAFPEFAKASSGYPAFHNYLDSD